MTESQWMSNFGSNLKVMLRGYGMTQTELAKETGLTEATISRYISGQTMPSAASLFNIAYALDCSLDDIADFGDKIDI